MAKDLQFHEAANLFPMMTDEEANALYDDIKVNGQKYAIELYEGKILDGRNRYVQCLKLGIECDTTDVTADVDDPIKHVLSANLHRRHLTASQKAMIGAKAGELYKKLKEDAKKRMLSGKKDPEKILPQGHRAPQTRDQIGKIVGTTGIMVDRGRKVIEKGVPELAKAVEEGRMSVTNAAKLTEMDTETQKQAAEDAKFSGGRYRPVKIQKDKEQTLSNDNKDKSRGVGVQYAHEAIACLKKIPRKDALRKRAYEIVADWIKANKNK